MGMWSVMGGEMVPAVISVSVSVVRVVSMSVAVSVCIGSYLVGVVMVVWRLFSMRKVKKAVESESRLILISPCIVMEVVGLLVYILSIAFCRFLMKSGTFVFGRLYIFMMVWIACVFLLFVCNSRMIVAVFGMCMSSITVVCILFLWYTVMSVLWMDV